MSVVPGQIGAGSIGRRWDAVVVGAGPAGSLAALELARRGRAVLLVDRAAFPRWKVCGACLGAVGIATLRRTGLGGVLDSLGARPIASAELVWRGRRAALPVRGMVAVSRRGLDLALAEAAERAGATVRFGVRAEADEGGTVRLETGTGSLTVQARAVVLACGLRRRPRPGDTRVAAGAWIGLGCSEPDGSGGGSGLTMMVGRRGYLGRVGTEDGVVNWAAAVDPAFVRSCGSPSAAMRAICDESGGAAHPPANGWTGTPALTRRSAVRRGRIYAIGDACGYVEPITGEGMSWALVTGEAAAPIVDRAIVTGCHTSEWERTHRRLMRWRRLRCLGVSRGLRSGMMMGCAMGMLGSGRVRRSGLVDRLIGGLS